jgi:hypothetical protein
MKALGFCGWARRWKNFGDASSMRSASLVVVSRSFSGARDDQPFRGQALEHGDRRGARDIEFVGKRAARWQPLADGEIAGDDHLLDGLVDLRGYRLAGGAIDVDRKQQFAS